MMTFSFYLALILPIFNSGLADLNFFDGDDAPLFQDSPGEDLFSADANMFASLPEGNLLNADISSCPNDDNEQAILQSRGVVCPTNPQTPFTNPTLPDLNDIQNMLEGKPNEPGRPEKNRPTGPYQLIQVPDQRELYANEPEYYCHLFVTPYDPPRPFTIPVCGSGRWFGVRGYWYSQVYQSRIR